MDTPAILKISNPVTSKSTLSFRDVTLDDVDLIRDIVNRYPTDSCDFSIGGILIWRNYFSYKIAVTDDTMFIIGTIPETGESFCHLPLGKLDPQTGIALLNQYFNQKEIKGFMICPDNVEAQQAETPENPLLNLEDWKEYLYLIDKFVTFRGKKMEKKRNHLNFFNNHYPSVTIRHIEDRDIPALVEFTRDFASVHESTPLFDYEEQMTIEAILTMQDCGYTGIVIKDGEKIIGYSLGELVGRTYFEHIEKGDIQYRGIYQALASNTARLAREINPDVLYLNREDDMGNENLRESKMSYHPDLYVVKHIMPIG